MTFPDLDAPVSRLRQRLIDDMNLRRFEHLPENRTVTEATN
jgi:hypothetical protein